MPPKLGGGGEKCARCVKTVYAAEKMSAASNVIRMLSTKCPFFIQFNNILFSFLDLAQRMFQM